MQIEQKQNRIFKPQSNTTLSAEETNQVTTELENVIRAGNLTPNAGTLTQVRDAMQNVVDTAANELQEQIDAITSASDVFDVVGTYAQLQAYDTSTVPVNDIIKVLQDETRNNAMTYYRWNGTSWVFIGAEGPYYTVAEVDQTFATKAQLPGIATTQQVGLVKPDGQTTIVQQDGTLSVSSNVAASLPLFTSIWADHILNNASYLRADTNSWQSGAVYTSAYAHLLDDYNDIEKQIVPFMTFQGDSVGYSRSPEFDVSGASHPYAFTAYYSESLNTIYADSSSVGIGKTCYTTANGSTVFGQTIGSGNGVARQKPTIETINGIRIAYFTANDGHKIVLENQENNISNIYAASGIAWYYILDTTNQRFKLPRSKWNFVGLRDTVGNYVAPGLPNITGKFTKTGRFVYGDKDNGTYYNSGALYGDDLQNGAQGCTQYGNGTGLRSIAFNAALSNSIYGASSTVQPPATQAYLYFYVGNTVQNETSVDVGEMTEAINDKVDLSSSWGTLSTTYDDLTEPSNNGYVDITAPADGWLYYARRKDSGNSNTNMWAVNTSHTEAFQVEHDGYWGGTLVSILFPVKKGNTIRFGRNNLTGNFMGCRFYYAQKTN